MNVNELERSISPERLRNSALRFQHSINKEVLFHQVLKKDLYDSYIFNERISKEIRFTLAQFEVILRNKVDAAMVASAGKNWLKNGVVKFGVKETNSIQDAENRISINRKTITHARLVAKLSFGFWVRMFTSPYNHRTSAQKNVIFPRNNSKFIAKPLSMSDVRIILESLNKLRNKVSHQEFILDPKYDISKVRDNCIHLMDLMNRNYYSNFAAYDHFSKEYSDFLTYKAFFLASKPEFIDFL